MHYSSPDGGGGGKRGKKNKRALFGRMVHARENAVYCFCLPSSHPMSCKHVNTDVHLGSIERDIHPVMSYVLGVFSGGGKKERLINMLILF